MPDSASKPDSRLTASVILCTYNRAQRLAKALATLDKQTVPADVSWEVLVVDNNSSDETRQVVESARASFATTLRYVFQPRQGKSFALNRGIELASGELLLFTDDDLSVHIAWLAATVQAFRHYGCIGTGGRIVAVWQQDPPRWYSESGPYQLMKAIVEYDLGRHPMPAHTPPFGANMAFRRQAFDRYGLFRTDLGPVGRARTLGEDTEFCNRLLKAGECIMYVPEAVVYHSVEPERLTKRYFQTFYYNIGRMQVRREEPPPYARYWFGVPRYLVRALMVNALKWLTGLSLKRRVCYRLECAKVLGQMEEARRRWSTPG